MEPTNRKFQTEEDYWRIRNLARETYLLNDCLERSWSAPRLDYWRWHLIQTVGTEPMEQAAWLWETGDGRLFAALVIAFSEVYIIIDPRLRTSDLEKELFARAEETLIANNPSGHRRLWVLVDEDDSLRAGVLESRGYTYRDKPVYRWRRDLDQPLPEVVVHPGYTIRSMGGPDEYAARAWASWRAFHPDEPDDGFDGGVWFANLQSAPMYRRDLDIVAQAPGGEIAAFSTIFYDDYTRGAVCVLVGTAPEHQCRGLAKAVIVEGLRRLQRMGGNRAFANGFDPPANALYRSVLGEAYKAESWFKTLG